MQDKYSKYVPMVTNYLKGLSKYEMLTQDNKKMLELTSLILLNYVSTFGQDFNKKYMLEIEYAAKKISKSQPIRKYILDHPNSPCLTLLLTEAFQNDLSKTLSKRQEVLESFAKTKSFPKNKSLVKKNDEETVSDQSEEINWNGFNRVFYRLVNDQDEFQIDNLTLIWLRLGELHLALGPRVEKYLGERNDDFDQLVIKRRVLSHFLIFEKTQSAQKSELLDMLDLLMLSGFGGLSKELELNLQLKFSKNLDGFKLQDVLKICIVLGEYSHVGQEFWQLAQYVIDDKIEEFSRFVNGDAHIIDLSRKYSFQSKLIQNGQQFESKQQNLSVTLQFLEYLQYTLGDKIDLSQYEQVARAKVSELLRFDLDVDHQILRSKGELMLLEEVAQNELALIYKNSGLLNELMEGFEFKSDISLTLLDALDLTRIEKLARQGSINNSKGENFGKFRVDWPVFKRALFKYL